MPEPWFSSTLDGMLPIGTSTPVSTAPVTAARGVESARVAGTGAQSPVLPERTSGDAGFAVMNYNAFSSEARVELLGAGDSNRIRLVKTTPGSNSTQYRMEYWNGTSWTIVGSVFDLNASATWYQVRIQWSGYGTSSGSVSFRVFADAGETLIASGSASGLNFTSLSGIVRIRYTDPRGAGNSYFSAAFIVDSGGDTSYVYTNVANADGSDTNGTGGFGSINSTGSTYDSTFISLPASGDRRSVKNTADRNYNNRTVRAVSVSARLRRGATGPSQARVYLTIGGIRYYHPTVLSLTTSFVSYSLVWENDPSTSAPWTISSAQAASLEWGVEAV